MQKLEFKVGDWVVVLPEDTWYSNAKRDKAQKILKIRHYVNMPYLLDNDKLYLKVRKASNQEILEAGGEIIETELNYSLF